MVTKTTLRLSPSKTLRWPWILRALISLNNVIMTNALKMIVKCWFGAAPCVSRPLSTSNNLSPTTNTTTTTVRWEYQPSLNRLISWTSSLTNKLNKFIQIIADVSFSAIAAAFVGTTVRQVSLQWTVSSHICVELGRIPRLGSSTYLVLSWCVSLPWSVGRAPPDCF